MISLILVMLAGICNSIMDITSFKYYRSIFSKCDPNFWNPEVSWKNKYIDCDPTKGRKKLFWKINYPVQLTDSWHFCKTLGIFSYIFAIVLFNSLTDNLLLDVLILGTGRNLAFSLFYNVILLSKT